MTTEPIIEVIRAAINLSKDDQPIWKLNGPLKTAICDEAGKYRVRSFAGGEEFFLTGIRTGKRSEYLFEFSPVDAQSYKHMEIADNPKSMEMIVGLEKWLVGVFGGTEKDSWSKLKRSYTRVVREKVREEVKATEASKYEKNPQWGAF